MASIARWTSVAGVLLRRALVCGIVLLAVGAASADEHYLDPQRWSSSSGGWTLEMDPSEPDGAGAAKYRLTHDGEVVWEKELAYSLREAVVSSKGVAIGYAYDNGFTGWGGNMVAVAIGADGAVLAEDKHERDGPRFYIEPPPPGEPRGGGVLLNEQSGYAVIMAERSDDDAKPVTWWLYDPTTGAHIKDWSPEAPNGKELDFSREITTAAVPGTPLIAVHWYIYKGSSARFEAIDPVNERSVWKLDILSEYAGMGEDWRWWELTDGVPQIKTKERGLAILSYKERQRISLDISKDEKGDWRVVETDRVAWEPPKKKETTAIDWHAEPIELETLGTVKLDVSKPKSPIHNVMSLSFDDHDRIGWVGWNNDDGGKGHAQFVLIEASGEPVTVFDLDLPERESGMRPDAIWLNGSRWLVAGQYYQDGVGHGEAWFLDVETRELMPIPEFESGSIEQLCRTANGGFVVLSNIFGNYTIRDQVGVYDAAGKSLKSTMTSGYGQGSSYSELCVLSNGVIATLDTVREQVSIWDEMGPATVNLRTLHEDFDQPYYCGLVADLDGGFVVLDTGGDDYKFLRVDRHGALRQTIKITGPAGEKFHPYDRWNVDRHGRAWVSDGSRIFRFGDDGTIDLVLGGPEEDSLGSLADLTIDRDGNVYVLEDGTSYVHVFDAEGRRTRVLKPKPGDVHSQEALSWISIDDDGVIRTRMNYDAPVLAFAADGTYLGPEPDVGERWERTWRPVGGSKQWESDGESVRRVVKEGEEPVVISRRPSNMWFRSIRSADVFPDGSIAVLAQEVGEGLMGIFGEGGPTYLCVYDAAGKPRKELEVPPLTRWFGRISADGDRVLLIDQKTITIVPMDGGPARVWSIPQKDGELVDVLVDSQAGVWWTWSQGSREVKSWRAP